MKKNRLSSLSLWVFVVSACFAVLTPSHALDLTKHAKLNAIATKLVDDGHYTRAELDALFATVEMKPSVIESITRPAEKKLVWHEYRNIFLKPDRIEQGVAFWRQYEAELQRAEQEYGVPAHMIVAIIGVESKFGKYRGKHRVLDSLSTLVEGFPRRSKFFGSELREFLILAKEEGLPATEIKGSYAGAVGFPQFISSSYRAYAVDFSGDGKTDLINQPIDAIGSVANYFKRHGWRAQKPVTMRLDSVPNAVSNLATRKLKTTQTAGGLKNAGLSLPQGLSEATELSVIRLEGEVAPQFYLGLPNFYVITRYNRSVLYAMAVHDLSQAIKQEYSS